MRMILLLISIALAVNANELTTSTEPYANNTIFTIAPTSVPISTTTSKPLKECPEGWIFGGTLGCFYFNTYKDKVVQHI